MENWTEKIAMADFVFNVSKGRAVEFYNRVKSNDPANAALIVLAINTSETDGVLKDLDTLQDVLNNASTAEVTNSGYARKTLTDADLAALSIDDTNDRIDLDIADQVFSAIVAGSAWTDIIIAYDADTTAGTDSNIIPIAQYDFPMTPDGSDITVQVNAAGFYRAA